MAWGTKGGPHDRASMNPAGSFGPDTWVGFVSSGDPGWDHYTTKDRATMVFNTHNTLVNDPHGDERQLWDGLR